MLGLRLLRTFGALFFGALVAQNTFAQMGSIDPLGTAVPMAQRSAPLSQAKDMVATSNAQAVRLRAEVWLKNDQLEGNLFIGEMWHEKPVAGLDIESVWILYPGGEWTSNQVRNDGSSQFVFVGGPARPIMSPVDVVVKIKGINDLLQVRYRLVYPRG